MNDVLHQKALTFLHKTLKVEDEIIPRSLEPEKKQQKLIFKELIPLKIKCQIVIVHSQRVNTASQKDASYQWIAELQKQVCLVK